MATDTRRVQAEDSTKTLVDEEPFPTKQLTILAICRFSEPIAFNSILAYTYAMVVDLNDGDDTNASFYAGLLVSAYAVAEALTAMMWGSLSDRYGRKPIVLLGLVGVAISSLIFGLAKNYWVAFLARVVGGALNGNVAVMQTMVAEMVRNPAHEPKAYAVQPFVWFLGSIIGSAMGGYLAQPAVFYPHLFDQDGLFGRYPYLLPNLVAVAAVIISVVQGLFFLEETNPIVAKPDHKASTAPAMATIDETSSLLSATGPPQASVRRNSAVPRPMFLEDSLPTSIDQTFDLRRSSFGTTHSIRLSRDQIPAGLSTESVLFDDEPTTLDVEPLTNRQIFNKSVVMLTGALVLIAYHQMAFGAILPIYLFDAPSSPVTPGGGHLDLYGGFGYTVHDVGAYMAVNGIIAIATQLLIFPIVVQRVGVWHSFVVTVALYPLAYIVIPFLTMLLGIEPEWLLPAGIYLSMFFQAVFGIVSGPCILILLKNATPSSSVLGKVNGFAMSASCAARTLSPPLVGFIYSQGSAAAWFSCALVAAIGAVQLLWVPREAHDHVPDVEVENPFKTGNADEHDDGHMPVVPE